jgi:hypothetical protein
VIAHREVERPADVRGSRKDGGAVPLLPPCVHHRRHLHREPLTEFAQGRHDPVAVVPHDDKRLAHPPGGERPERVLQDRTPGEPLERLRGRLQVILAEAAARSGREDHRRRRGLRR